MKIIRPVRSKVPRRGFLILSSLLFDHYKDSRRTSTQDHKYLTPVYKAN